MPHFQHLEFLSRGPVSKVRLLSQRPASVNAALTKEWNIVADGGNCPFSPSGIFLI